MKTKNILKTVAFAMLMPTMLLTTACSSEDDMVNNTANNTVENAEVVAKKGYALPVTVNVTRQDDGTTRTTYTDNGNKTGTLDFSEGDKLFVEGLDEGGFGSFSGTLDYDPATEKFEGTIYTEFDGTIDTEIDYNSTAEELFVAATEDDKIRATLLPAGYESYDFLSINTSDDEDEYNDKLDLPIWTTAFALTKVKAVEQFSYEQADSYSDGFALAPKFAILNFTITGLTHDTEVAVFFIQETFWINKNVTTDGSGNATFAIGLPDGVDLSSYTLTVAGNPVTITSSSKTLTAGKIYNITRVANAINGKFSVGAEKKVYFSKGNLRYASGTWSFFDNQYDYYTSYSADAWDKFGWSTSANTYGMSTSQSSSTYSGDFVDWGATMGTGWRTLTSDEWTYLFNTRSASTVGGTSNGRYAKAKVNNVQGVILFPDTYTHPDGVTAPVGVNAIGDTGWNGNNYSSADWTKMESAGCVFLPAAGYRNGSSVYDAATSGIYRSATPYDSDYAYYVEFLSSGLNPAANTYVRGLGFSVRLVHDAN